MQCCSQSICINGKGINCVTMFLSCEESLYFDYTKSIWMYLLGFNCSATKYAYRIPSNVNCYTWICFLWWIITLIGRKSLLAFNCSAKKYAYRQRLTVILLKLCIESLLWLQISNQFRYIFWCSFAQQQSMPTVKV